MKNLKERLTTAVDSILVEELEILHILYGMQIIPCKKEHTMTNTFDLRSLNQDLLNEEKNRCQNDLYVEHSISYPLEIRFSCLLP